MTPYRERPYRTENLYQYVFWYVERIFGTRFAGTVRGTDFRGAYKNSTPYGGPLMILLRLYRDDFRFGFLSVRYLIRILYEIIRTGTDFFRYGFWYGAKYRKIKKRKILSEFSFVSPYRNGFFVPNSGPHSVPIKVTDQNPKPCRHICLDWMPFFVVDSVLI